MPTAGAAFLDDRYRLDERLAAGRFGDVWRATDVVLNRLVAVKLRHPGYQPSPPGRGKPVHPARTTPVRLVNAAGPGS